MKKHVCEKAIIAEALIRDALAESKRDQIPLAEVFIRWSKQAITLGRADVAADYAKMAELSEMISPGFRA